jgi:predicted lactoylglutathione lyase
MTVPARVSVVTLGVTDVARSTEFYERLGWPLSPASVPGEVSFFHTAGGILALWGAADLAADAGVTDGVSAGFRGVALAVNCESREQVDEALRAAEEAGANILQRAKVAEWGGYLGYFADPDGHVWEVTHNPDWPMDGDGRPALP